MYNIVFCVYMDAARWIGGRPMSAIWSMEPTVLFFIQSSLRMRHSTCSPPTCAGEYTVSQTATEHTVLLRSSDVNKCNRAWTKSNQFYCTILCRPRNSPVHHKASPEGGNLKLLSICVFCFLFCWVILLLVLSPDGQWKGFPISHPENVLLSLSFSVIHVWILD